MRYIRIIGITVLLLFISIAGYTQPRISAPRLKVMEEDGDPVAKSVTEIKVTNDALTKTSNSKVSIDLSAGAGDVTAVFSCASGDCNNVKVEAGETLELDDDVYFNIGDDADYQFGFDQSGEGSANFQTSHNNSANADVAAWTFSADDDNSGAETADSEVFEVGKNGSDDADGNFVELFAIDEDGDAMIAGTITAAGITSTGTVDFGGATIELDNQADCSGVTGEGQACWDSDDDTLYVGDGAAASEIGGGSGGATYREITLLPESAVLDDSSPPSISIVESTGTGTPRFRVAAFDPDTDEILYWSLVMPSDYDAGSTSYADVYWFSNDTGANEDCIWALAVSATTEGDADDMEEQAADTANTESEDVNATEADRLIKTRITLSNMDSAAAGDAVTIRFYRDADDSEGDADADALTSDAELHSIHLLLPRS